MSMAALAPQHDEYTTTGIGEIRVIAGGLANDRKIPRHARAKRTNIAYAPAQGKTLASMVQNAGGISYELSTRERACAIGASALFAISALAAMAL